LNTPAAKIGHTNPRQPHSSFQDSKGYLNRTMERSESHVISAGQRLALHPQVHL
jgi:hypothetical protein